MPGFVTTHPKFDAIICDVDGCLCAETSTPFDLDALGYIAEHNRLAQEKRDRPLLTLCTGRPQPYAEAMCRLLANISLSLICENGVWLYVPLKNTYILDPGITPEQKKAVREAAIWMDEQFGPKGVQQQPGKTCSVSLYHTDTEYLKTLVPVLKAEFERRGWPMRVSMTWFYINCDLKHISKSTGLDQLIAREGLTKARLAGVGDTTSDLAIREHVTWFACPSNAADELKHHADYVAREPVTRGVVEIIQKIMAE